MHATRMPMHSSTQVTTLSTISCARPPPVCHSVWVACVGASYCVRGRGSSQSTLKSTNRMSSKHKSGCGSLDGDGARARRHTRRIPPRIRSQRRCHMPYREHRLAEPPEAPFPGGTMEAGHGGRDGAPRHVHTERPGRGTGTDDAYGAAAAAATTAAATGASQHRPPPAHPV